MACALVCLLTVGLMTLTATAAETGAAIGPATIHLTNGSYASGKLVASADGENLIWQSPAFVSPFKFPLDAVNAVHFPVPDKVPQPTGDYCFELAGGDILFGDLISLDDDQAVVDVGGFGRLQVERRILRRMFRWNGGNQLLYFGPSGLAGWQTVGKSAWHEEAGHLIADQKGAAIRRDFGIPPQACFDFEISWTKAPDFELALGVDADPNSALRAFRLEIWQSQLVAQRETEREADVAAIKDIKSGPDRIRLLAFLDQQKGRLLIYSAEGQKLADLAVTTAAPQPRGGIQLVNKGGDVRLERLRISRWDGTAPRLAGAAKSRIYGADGAVVYGQLKSLDAAKNEFVVTTENGEKRMAAADMSDAFFAALGEDSARLLRAVHLSGVRVSGELVKVDQRTIWIKCPGIREPLVSSIESLHALMILEHRGDPPDVSGRRGRLETEGAHLRGGLVDGQEGDASCLVWQPTYSSTASPLARGAAARIVYRDPPPQTLTVRSNRVLTAPVLRRPLAQSVLEIEHTAMATARRATGGQSVLHLRSGDTFQCAVASVSEKGVHLKSALTDATFVPNAEIKVLELQPDAAAVTIAAPKKERLLTLPRMQRENPPTQLIRSTQGDYLRGRLVAMNEKELAVEIRLETKTVPRANVARIIWLHADEIDDASAPVEEPPAVTRVQALPADGNRLTFRAEKVEGSTLSGTSNLLGKCRVDLQTIDQLLVGAAIEQNASQLAFHQWKLKPALDPLAAEEGEPIDSDGLSSVLIGKPAPPIDLELLGGGRFQLAGRKGQVIVLDFWASWCGPCLQLMPQVDAVVGEFAAENVRLISINQQETPERIKTVLERLGLKTAGALDREGLVAERYGANTIPQTVIINREGNVARVFASTSSRFDEQFRAALKSVLAGPAAAE